MAENWSRHEVETVVADYFAMLVKDLMGERYRKVDHYRGLAAELPLRSQKSIEFKYANISAALRDMDMPWIPGVTPKSNYQGLLAEVIAEYLRGDARVIESIRHSTDALAEAPRVLDYVVPFEEPPAPSESSPIPNHSIPNPLIRVMPQVNYLEREARNASLGRAGEEFVVSLERQRLERVGADRFVDRVEHVALTLGDGLGFDVRSFNADGTDRFIEVKTTAYGKQTPFYVSGNELRASCRHSEEYHLYRVFEFRSKPRLFALQGALSEACTLEPVQYVARAG